MAVVKSFELNGKKQSFANWISNLSPEATPFASMIGKKVIDQTQYSWQTDSLAPASNETFEEGSDAIMKPRATTHEYHNFTSIFRSVASVSDTVKELDTYGRNNEMNYQLGKAGKEVKRDLEYALLHNVNGVPGAPDRASNFAGFEGLVGGLGVPDPDTGAVVHQEAEIAAGKVDLQAIFSITANLFIAGSKADKIMFHPKYASSFSDLIGDYSETPKVYRMFDNLDPKFNLQVKRIKDPLGRYYTLIPNRFMPEDKIYFFNEGDWTQTILRAPATTKLAKRGSSEQYMVEMEVGLVHRHPYASGVLALRTVDVKNDFKPGRALFTADVGDSQMVRCNILVDNVAEKDLVVYFYTSDPNVISFEKETALTSATGRVDNKLIAGTKEGVAQVWTVCKGVKSSVTEITTMKPTVSLETSELKPSVGSKVTLTVTIRKATAIPAGDGLTVKWYSDKPGSIEFGSITSDTKLGVATVEATIRKLEPILVQGVFVDNTSNPVILNPDPVIVTGDFNLQKEAFGIGETSILDAYVSDGLGNSMSGVKVDWRLEPPGVASINLDSSVSGMNGNATAILTGVSVGNGFVIPSIKGEDFDPIAFEVTNGSLLRVELEVNPNPYNFGDTLTLKATVTSNGTPEVGKNVSWEFISATPTPLPVSGVTGVDGSFETTMIPDTNSDYGIQAICEGAKSSVVDVICNP